MASEFDVVVIGAGVVGLSCAVELARHGHFVGVVEKNEDIALEGSSRTSGVIHSGIYYPTGSLKQRLCVRGRELLYERAKKHAIPHAKLGQLIIACDASEEKVLELLFHRAKDNGAGPVHWLNSKELQKEEALARGHAALLVEETGIVRTREFARSLLREAWSLGVEVLCGVPIDSLERQGQMWSIQSRAAGFELRAPLVINAAGVHADRVAQLAGINVDAFGLRHRYAKGTWMALDARFRKAITRLLYPVPHAFSQNGPESLGIHLTRDLEGFLIAGPDCEWLEAIDWGLDPSEERKKRFVEALEPFFPGLHPSDLCPLSCGIRPKLHGPSERAADFLIREASEWGAPGLVLLLGIESPGLTASLAIGEHVRKIATSSLL
ncbi:MAG: NAD(P)/FAD-dependent oxidoreductase [Sandaracinaceae bacterium]|nr:NAD(P)/FAD-dependent oxidoreductase [Sandaracinaceae bacterium]